MTNDMSFDPPQEINLDLPAAARVYDWLLGGSRNFAVDRAHGDRLLARLPGAAYMAWQNRALMQRAVRYATAQGINQFLDIGSGIPTMDNTHQLADAANSFSRCVYVDIDPVAVADARRLLAQAGDRNRHAVVQGDLTQPDELLRAVAGTGVLNMEETICLVVTAVFHFVGPQHHPRALMATYRDAVAPDSMVIVTHATLDGVPEPQHSQMLAAYELTKNTAQPGYLRSRQEIEQLVDGWRLEYPGVVWTSDWHPDEPAERPGPQSGALVAVARKPW